jgi:hypothetical protein
MELEMKKQASQVMALIAASYPSFTLEQVLRDLRHTKSVEVTVNRIFDGMVFLSLISSFLLTLILFLLQANHK